MDILCTKEIIKHVTLGIPKGIKNVVSTSFAFTFDILIRIEKYKELFEKILHVE